LAVAAPAAAQDAAKPADQSELRHHIYVMEGALARAVNFGAKKLSQEVRSVMPDVFVLAGEAQARGVYLEEYGVFFDVEVPMLRQSMMWSLRMMLDQNETATQKDINDLRTYLKGITNPATRASLESALRRLEQQAAPVGAQARTAAGRGTDVRAAVVLPDSGTVTAAPTPVVAERTWMQDPNRAYTEAVQRALVDAMIDFSAPMKIAPTEWLTVAAHDNERRDMFAPQDPFEEVVTVLLRIKGADLLAYRAGKIDQDEARRRVQLREF
jgi:hypothetical protein